MSKIAVIIEGIDITKYVEELNPSINGLNADGSGRDVQTGLMKITKIADKWKFEVKLLRIYEDAWAPIRAALRKVPYAATVGEAQGNFYTDTLPFGSARWDKFANKTYYDGIAFSMTEM